MIGEPEIVSKRESTKFKLEVPVEEILRLLQGIPPQGVTAAIFTPGSPASRPTISEVYIPTAKLILTWTEERDVKE